MKKKFLAALFAVVAVLGLIGVVSASPGTVTPTEEVTLPNKLVLKKVDRTDINLSSLPGDVVQDVWVVKSGQDCTGNVDIPALYPDKDGVYLEVKAIGAVSDSLPRNNTGTDIPLIDEYPAFRDIGITRITIPDTVVQIGTYAFANAKGLRTLEIHDGITDIGDSAFEGCANLTSVTFEDNANSSTTVPATLNIGSHAFERCGMASLTLPQHLKSIGDRAFYLCDKLKEVYIWGGSFASATGSPGWTSWAFKGCPLTNVYISKNLKGNIPADAFDFPTPSGDSDTGSAADTLLIHFEGEKNNLFSATGAAGDPTHTDWEAYIHKLTLMEKRITPSTCLDNGEAFRNIVCSDLPAHSHSKTDTLKAPGHDHRYKDNPSLDPLYLTYVDKAKSDAEDSPEGYTDCVPLPWTYYSRCLRCQKDEIPIPQEIAPTGDHEYKNDLGKDTLETILPSLKPEKYNSADPKFSYIFPDDSTDPNADTYAKYKNKKIDAFSPPTCKKDGDGFIKWSAVCDKCSHSCKQELELKQSDFVSNNHTWYGTNEITITIPAACGHDSVAVTYLICDGAKEYGGNHPGVIKPCDPDFPVEPDDPLARRCEQLIDLQNAIADLEKEAEKYELSEEVKGIIEDAKENEEEPDISLEQLDTEKLKAARERVETALAALKTHLFNAHDTNDDPGDCVVRWEPVTAPKGHSDYPKPLGDPVYTNLSQDGPYLCTEGGYKITKSFCPYCGEIIRDGDDDPLPKDAHLVQADLEDTIPASCTEPAKKVYQPGAVCGHKGCKFKVPENGEPVTIPDPTSKPKGHSWGDFEPDGGTMPEPNDNCIEKKVEGKLTCTECGADYEKETGEKATKTIPGKSEHTWEWVPNADGKTETQVCKVKGCGKTGQTRDIVTSTPSTPTEPEPEPEPGPSGPSTPTPDPDATYTISVSYGSGGTASASPTSAKSGTSVTITILPNSGYELDMLRVTADKVISTSSQGGGKYSFTMPAANVKVGVTFSQVASSSKWPSSSGSSSSGSSSSSSQTVIQSIPQASASGQLFSDVPAAHWAAGEINWANQMGYMNGTSGGGFNPNGNITHQQLWMILARLTGNNPSNMADAKRWAVNGGFADGSAPEGPINRHQLVTALYRCAHLMGSSNRNTATLAGFPDSRLVPIVAREPFAWAVANGIIGGNADGRLDPNGTLTRAQFAVILYRFSQRV